MTATDWVPCRHRAPGEPLPTCTHPARPGFRLLPSVCVRCPFAGIAEPPPVPTAPVPPAPAEPDAMLPCGHRGEVLRTVPCELCGGRGRTIPVHACAVRGECTPSRVSRSQTLPLCTTCDRRE